VCVCAYGCVHLLLQLRLQQRRTREQLADQGIMPRDRWIHAHSRERERKKERKADTAGRQLGELSLSAHAQMRLKRARLADDLNEKLALRPGPLELVQKNIIPLDSAVRAATMTGISRETARHIANHLHPILCDFRS
uniref:Phosphatase and actin regulator n=1 Tax=Myripristis murdjan TaxID=586833 RepID=A0A668AEH3_9TELE